MSPAPTGRAAASATLIARGLLCGLAGTAVMTATGTLHDRLRGETDRVIDYDTSEHVTIAAMTLLRIRPRTPAQESALFHLVHWGYGSAVAIAHEALARSVPPAEAARIFYAGCQSMAFTLFPLLGRTPVPWRWPPDVIAISLLQHAVYVATVVCAHRLLCSPAPRVPTRSPLIGATGPDSTTLPRRVLKWAGQGRRGASNQHRRGPA